MAKESIKARQRKREKMVAKYAAKRAALLEAGDYEGLQKLPKNSCDQATIYRCLNQFVEVQLVNTSFLEKDMAHFEYNDPHHHHHHIICKICKKIESFHECLMEKIELGLQKKGYKDIQHRLEIFAVCESCAKG